MRLLLVATVGFVLGCGSPLVQPPSVRPQYTPAPSQSTWENLPSQPADEVFDDVSEETAKTYIVQKGDTLYGIARKFGVSVPALASENAMKVNGVLKTGTVLRIP